MAADAETGAAVGKGASAYATGGGGIVLEHTFGATLLAALLLGDPVPGLGDEQTVVSVTFQAGRFSPVDDIVVVGEPRGQPAALGRQLSIGVRRNPRIGPGNHAFVALLADYLRNVQHEWERIHTGQLRLALVVAAPHAGVRELAALADFARKQPSDPEFRNAMAAPRATSTQIRRRLDLLDRAVTAAARGCGIDLPPGGVSELTWRLLFAIRPIETRLEGDDAPDRTATVTKLRDGIREASEADSLFTELCQLASSYAPAGASVDEAILRRDLVGKARLGRSSSHQQVWEVIGDLGRRLRERTRQDLTSGGGQPLRLERSAARDALIEAMKRAGTGGASLVVTGDPDVGKSALTLAAAAELTTQGEEVIALSLRDLPASVWEANNTLGAPMRSVFGSLAVSPIRLLVVDGAEAALEGRSDLLVELGECARRAGIGLVAVTRSDARRQVAEALTPGTPDSQSPAEFNIEGLASEEVKEVIAVFGSLRRVAGEPRSAWLLERLGLIDLLLRADVFTALPDGALSEADVFAAVWYGLVRRSERNEPGRGSPDGRESVLIDLARRQILREPSTSPPVDAAALRSLRSDGLLLAPGTTAAWSPGDQFATDLVRDFALARLFLTHGWAPLKDAGAPRWALRAARLACQAGFAQSGLTTENARIELQKVFDNLALEYGDRWADLPLEALITLGSPHDALEQAWGALVTDDGKGIDRLLRLVLQRHTEAQVADPILAEPIVQLVFDHASELPDLAENVRESVNEIEISWLRGLALRERNDTSNALRERLRDRLLASDPHRHNEHAQECLALMGPDLDTVVEEHLRELAAGAPAFLAPCVETLAPMSMAVHRPQLLLALAEAYYILERNAWNRGFEAHDQGVRGHHKKGGFGSPLASWYYGPFWSLLISVPWRAIPFINRLLDHAARARAQLLNSLSADAGLSGPIDEGSMPGVDLEVLGIGICRFVGDEHAWRWYRGSSVGPYPCMSALMAVERFVDQVHSLGIDLRTLSTRLLTDCHNLAMPGLVFGFLVRHLDEVTDELDPWLAEPDIWGLEFQRTTSEGHLHVQGPDPEDLHGRAYRGMSPRDVAIELALRAIVAHDEVGITRLRSVGDKLVERACALYGPDPATPGFEERMTLVRNWSSFLRAESYEAVTLPDGRVGLQYTPPEVSDEFMAQQVELDRGMQILRLLNYAYLHSRQPVDVGNLIGDLKLAIQLYEQPPERGQEFGIDAFPGIAATAIIAFVEGHVQLEHKDLEWSAGIVLQAAFTTSDNESTDPSFFDMGKDRSAALALPCLLLPPFNEDAPSRLDGKDLNLIRNALIRLMTSGSDEVRRQAAKGLSRVWSAPCTTGAGSRCRHEVAFGAVEASVRDCRMGAFDYKKQRRRLRPIKSNLAEALNRIEPEDLLLGRLVAPLIASSACAGSTCCVSGRAAPLRDALLRAHARGAVSWIGKNFQLDIHPGVQEAIADCMLGIAGQGNVGALQTYVETLMEEPTALWQFLDEIARIATYDATQRQVLKRVWPAVMARALEVMEAGGDPFRQKGRYGHRDRDKAVAALVLKPQMRLNDTDFDATLKPVRGDWLELGALEPLIARWLPFAVGVPECVDSMVGFIDTMPPLVQVSRGLDLVLQIVDDHFDLIAKHTWFLGSWLERLLATHLLGGETLATFHLLVDGLAAHGDSRAVRIQKSLE